MLIIDERGILGQLPMPFNYVKNVGLLGAVALPITRYMRAASVLRYMERAEKCLDIGCGDGYFLKRSPCVIRIGLDPLLSDKIDNKLEFPDSYFDYVTLLAVIEHIEDPAPLIWEIARVLKTSGRLIITTPKARAHGILRMYSKSVDDEHVAYYDNAKLAELTKGRFKLFDSKTFFFGMNQVFCFEKSAKDRKP